MTMMTLLASGMAGAAAFLIVAGLFPTLQGLAGQGMDRFRGYYDRELTLAFEMDMSAERFVALLLSGAGLVAAASIVLAGNIPLALVGAAGVLATPFLLVTNFADRRRRAMDEGLPTALQQLASALQSGMSPTQAIGQVSQMAPAPLDREFRIISQQIRARKSLEEALRFSRTRLQSKYFDMFTLVLTTAARHGGRVHEAVQNLADVIIELERLQQKVTSAIEKGRRTMKLMSVVPLLIIGGTFLYDRSMITALTETGLGVGIVVLATTLYVTALFIGWRMSKVDI